MNDKQSTKFGIRVDKMSEHQFSIGLCFSHWVDETYLCLNLFKWTISIGFIGE